VTQRNNAVFDYFRNIWKVGFSTFEGLAVTFSWMFRRPITVQYPDKIDKPIPETLPDNYRGFLEVDIERCTGCSQCAKACPIGCIALDIEKNAETKERLITRCDVDLAKCMYCGLCVEACKFGAIRHSREFEGTTCTRDNLVLHYCTEPRPVAKPRKKPKEGEPPVPEPAVKPVGSIVRQKLKPCFDDSEGAS